MYIINAVNICWIIEKMTNCLFVFCFVLEVFKVSLRAKFDLTPSQNFHFSTLNYERRANGFQN